MRGNTVPTAQAKAPTVRTKFTTTDLPHYRNLPAQKILAELLNLAAKETSIFKTKEEKKLGDLLATLEITIAIQDKLTNIEKEKSGTLNEKEKEKEKEEEEEEESDKPPTLYIASVEAFNKKRGDCRLEVERILGSALTSETGSSTHTLDTGERAKNLWISEIADLCPDFKLIYHGARKVADNAGFFASDFSKQIKKLMMNEYQYTVVNAFSDLLKTLKQRNITHVKYVDVMEEEKQKAEEANQKAERAKQKTGKAKRKVEEEKQKTEKAEEAEKEAKENVLNVTAKFEKVKLKRKEDKRQWKERESQWQEEKTQWMSLMQASQPLFDTSQINTLPRERRILIKNSGTNRYACIEAIRLRLEDKQDLSLNTLLEQLLKANTVEADQDNTVETWLSNNSISQNPISQKMTEVLGKYKTLPSLNIIEPKTLNNHYKAIALLYKNGGFFPKNKDLSDQFNDYRKAPALKAEPVESANNFGH